MLATAGMVGPHGVNWLWPLLPVVGLAVFGVLLPPRPQERVSLSGVSAAHNHSLAEPVAPEP